MMVWLVAGSIALVELATLAWVWALCRAAALGDRAAAARGPWRPVSVVPGSAPGTAAVRIRRVTASRRAWAADAWRIRGPR